MLLIQLFFSFHRVLYVLISLLEGFSINSLIIEIGSFYQMWFCHLSIFSFQLISIVF